MGRRPSTLNHRLDTFGEIHKRAILFDNEVKKETRNEGPNLHYGDRFIPRRRKNQSNSNTSNELTPGNEDCAKANGTYAELLRSALDLKVSRQLILNDHCIPRLFFARQGSSSSSDRQADDNFYYYPQECFCSSPTRYKDLDWMCKPRKKPAVDANSSHEFRGFSGTAVGTQIEWAWTGHIVSYWQNSLLLWNPDEDIITKYELEDVVTLAYHPHSHFLATSNHHKTRPSVNVWSLERGAMQKYFSHRPRSNYMITTLCWHKHGIHLLTGNVEGVLSTLDFSGTKELFHSTPAVHSMIKDIKFSATAQYVASLDILGKLCIWSYNSGYLMLHHTWDSGMSTNHISMDWHPWTDFDIVLCIQRGSMVLVLNILSKQTEAYSTGRAFKFDRPVVSFNRYSAELVVGCQRKVRHGYQNNILVLGAVDEVVDEVQGVGSFDTGFMWSPNNEQLALVAGNNLQIYNFFGTATTANSVSRAAAAAAATSTASSSPMASNLANLTGTNFSIFKQFNFIK